MGNNQNLIPEGVRRIDSEAFADCFSLEGLKIGSNVIEMGSNLFTSWGYGGIHQEVHVYGLAAAPEGWANDYNNLMHATNSEIIFHTDGGGEVQVYEITLVNGVGLPSAIVNAHFNETLPKVNPPSREEYNFKGYWTGENGIGVSYYDAQGNGATWDKQEGDLLYANWELKTYEISLDQQGGTGGSEKIKVAFNNSMPTTDTAGLNLVKPQKDNFVFKGYYSMANGGGANYYNSSMNPTSEKWNNKSITSLYAHWQGEQKTVNLNSDGGTGGSSSVIATFDSVMPEKDNNGVSVAPPEKYGYTFEGYYSEKNGNGIKFYQVNSDKKVVPTSAKWKNVTITDLYANWVAVKKDVYLNAGAGSGSVYVEATFGEAMPTVDKNGRTLAVPTLQYKAFKGYYTQQNGKGKKLYNENMNPTFIVWDNLDWTTLYSKWEDQFITITFDFNGGSGGTINKIAKVGDKLSGTGVTAPTRYGYIFNGYYTSASGGNEYFNANMTSDVTIESNESVTLYARWNKANFTVTFLDPDSTGTKNVQVLYDSNFTTVKIGYSFRTGYIFKGYYTQEKGAGVKYFEPVGEYQNYNSLSPCTTNKMTGNITLYAHYEMLKVDLTVYWDNYGGKDGFKELKQITYFSSYLTFNCQASKDGYNFVRWEIKYDDVVVNLPDGQTEWIFTGYGKISANGTYPTVKPIIATAIYTKSCVAEGTLITLADGSQKAVEQLTASDLLLVWNMKTGKFDYAPILFIDSDPFAMYEVINLYFSDGTSVKVISEHAFWDFDLNKYVYLRADAAQYIGHWFNKQILDEQGNMSWTRVQLTNVVVQDEYTTAWSPVTYGYLCYYVNGMLSMPGGVTGFINIFEVDADTLMINQEAFLADIETYGLFTYEEFAQILPIPEIVYEAFDVQYLKVSMGKGLITWEMLENLVKTYSDIFEALI